MRPYLLLRVQSHPVRFGLETILVLAHLLNDCMSLSDWMPAVGRMIIPVNLAEVWCSSRTKTSVL